MFWNKFPYTNFHDLNLDWLLENVKDDKQRILDIIRGDIVVGRATADGAGNVIVETYETKADAASTLQGLKSGTILVGRATGDEKGNNIFHTYQTKADAENVLNMLKDGSIKVAEAENADHAVDAITAEQDGAGNVIIQTYETKNHAAAEVARLDGRIDNIPGGGGGTQTDFFDMSNVFVFADDTLNFSSSSNWYTNLMSKYGQTSSTWDYRVSPRIGFAAKNADNQNFIEYFNSILPGISSEKRNATKTVLLSLGKNDVNGTNAGTNAKTALSLLTNNFPNAKIVLIPGINWSKIFSVIIEIIGVFKNSSKSFVADLAYTWLGLHEEAVESDGTTYYLSESGNMIVFTQIYSYLKTFNSNHVAVFSKIGTNPTVTAAHNEIVLNNGILTCKMTFNTSGGFPIDVGNFFPSTLKIDDKITGVDAVRATITGWGDKVLTYRYELRTPFNAPTFTAYVVSVGDFGPVTTELTVTENGYFPSNVDINLQFSFPYPLSSGIA